MGHTIHKIHQNSPKMNLHEPNQSNNKFENNSDNYLIELNNAFNKNRDYFNSKCIYLINFIQSLSFRISNSFSRKILFTILK
jgi:hypothetical protein